MAADRDFLFEKFIDNLELYLTYREEFTKKQRMLFERKPYLDSDADNELWEERDTMDALRQVTRRALDEYVLTGLARSPNNVSVRD